MARKLPRHHQVRYENELIQKREKEFRHEELWSGQKRYYEEWEKKNRKYDEWTSPRYFENHNKLVEKMKKTRQHEEDLEKRREELRKLLTEEEKLYQIELMVQKTKNASFVRSPRPDEIPTEVLKELNNGISWIK